MMESANKQCVVVFPIYKSLSRLEREVFENAIEMTEGFPKMFIAPQGMKLDDTFGDKLKDIDIVYFDRKFFTGTYGYNLLMLSKEFYDAFINFEYILIHQSDAYLFKPELKLWCDKGYGYIGAPWLKPNKLKRGKFYQILIKCFSNLYPERKRKRHKTYNAVGNGGLSLRRVDTFRKVLELPKIQATLVEYIDKLEGESFYNEDVFWGIEAPRFYKKFTKPDWKEALSFSVENHVELSYKLLGNQLPFACHAFDVHGTDFWKQFIKPLQD